NNKAYDWHMLGERSFKISCAAIAIGVFFVILKPFVPSIQQPSDLIIGGILSMIAGTVLMMKFSKSEGAPEVEEPPAEPESNAFEESDFFSDSNDGGGEEEIDCFQDSEEEDGGSIW